MKSVYRYGSGQISERARAVYIYCVCCGVGLIPPSSLFDASPYMTLFANPNRRRLKTSNRNEFQRRGKAMRLQTAMQLQALALVLALAVVVVAVRMVVVAVAVSADGESFRPTFQEPNPVPPPLLPLQPIRPHTLWLHPSR